MPKKLIEALSDVAIRGSKPQDRDYKKHDGHGLFLLVKTNGSRLWRLKYRFAGRERLLALGEYPDCSLMAAHERASQARDLVRQGIDPVQHGREVKAQRITAALNTFRTMAERWMVEASKARDWTKGHIEQNRQSLHDFVYPKLGDRPISAITAAEIESVLRPLQQAGKLETMRRVRQRVRSIMAYAVQIGLRPDNPALHTQGGLYAVPKRKHFASIKPSELPEFLKALEAYNGHPNTKAIIWMILWTGARTGEVRGATPQEFDLDAGHWQIPASRMKKRRAHVMPLPPQAIEMLRELSAINTGSKYTFPSPCWRQRNTDPPRQLKTDPPPLS